MPDNQQQPINAPRGSFLAARQIYGLYFGRSYVSERTWQRVEDAFGTKNVMQAAQFPHVLVALHSHNALHVLTAKLPELCTALDLESMEVIDMSDWTVREFVIDKPVTALSE
jgi:hypothetical protein